MTFGKAIKEMQDGKAIRLTQWSEEVKIQIQNPDEHSKMTAPYFYVTSRFGLVPWIPTMIEMLSTEWKVILENEVNNDFSDPMPKSLDRGSHPDDT